MSDYGKGFDSDSHFTIKNRILTKYQWARLRTILLSISDTRFIFNHQRDLEGYIGIFVPPRGDTVYRIFIAEELDACRY